MPLTLLQLADFRNFAKAHLEPSHHGLNIFYGDNGSGKTSLLEAIYYLSAGRSFLTARYPTLVRHSTEKFSIFAQILHNHQRIVPIGTERSLDGVARMRMAEKEVISIAELASFLPIRIIHAQSHYLFESGPIFRRKYLDWGLFYQDPNFISCWRAFEKTLRQRNAILRQKHGIQAFEAWTVELAQHACHLDTLRRAYIEQLLPYFQAAAETLLGISSLQIHYEAGWDTTQDYYTLLMAHRSAEFRQGHTLFGPHRADFDIQKQGVSMKQFLSRGQQKLLIYAMILAQGQCFSAQSKGLVYLIDDLPSELDF